MGPWEAIFHFQKMDDQSCVPPGLTGGKEDEQVPCQGFEESVAVLPVIKRSRQRLEQFNWRLAAKMKETR